MAARGVGRRNLRCVLRRVYIAEVNFDERHVARVGLKLVYRDDQIFGEHAAPHFRRRNIGRLFVVLHVRWRVIAEGHADLEGHAI